MIQPGLVTVLCTVTMIQHRLDPPERITLACSKVSQDRLRVRFVQFGEETRHQMPRKVATQPARWRRR
jgi:hypothetical protein